MAAQAELLSGGGPCESLVIWQQSNSFPGGGLMAFSVLWACLGGLLVSLALFDFYTTTMTLKGGGPLSSRLPHRLWRLCLHLHQRVGAPRLLSAAGPSLLLLMILVWFGLCWLGWLLIFSASAEAVVNADTLVPATWVERLYFAGYTLTTVGYGDFKANTSAAQIAAVFAGFNGLFLLTLAITYSMPILSASATRRQIALQINILGRNPDEIITRHNEQGSFSFLASQLQQLNTQIAAVSQQHLAYPILHYFHDNRRSHALPLNIACLQEACTAILFAFPQLPYATRAQLEATQAVIDDFVDNVRPVVAEQRTDIPKPPACTGLESLSQAERTSLEVREYMQSQQRRRLLLGLIESDGWDWDDVLEAAAAGAD